jgi:hypothetical protein
MEDNTVVYTHTRLDTNEIFYVGIGKPTRPYSDKNRNKWWKHIINKTDYQVDIIFTNLGWDEACAREITLIKLYGRIDQGNGTLVNMTDGGDGTNGRVVPESEKERLREYWSGRIFSEEHKRKISEASKGKKKSPEHIRNSYLPRLKTINQLNLDGKFIREWESPRKAEREGGFNNSHIIQVCKGNIRQHKGFKWEYKTK